MRLWLPAYIAIAAGCCFEARSAGLEREDLRSIREILRKSDASLDWFLANAKAPLDSTASVMIVMASPMELRQVSPSLPPKRLPVPGKTTIGVFVVSGAPNQVRQVLDVFPNDETNGFPSIGERDSNSINLHFFSEYGIYEGSVKYFLGPNGGKPPRKLRFRRLALTSSTVQDGKIVYIASSRNPLDPREDTRRRRIEIDPRPDGALPGYKIVETAPAGPDRPALPVRLRLPDGRAVEIASGGISISGVVYPVPVPTLAMKRKLSPEQLAPLEIENHIGPFVLDGHAIWFANSFYDGEGTTGIGAIGSFDLDTHRFEMRYLPEIARWSGSAIRADGDDLWIGLMRQPEGAAFGGGLLRFNRKTGAAAVSKVPGYIYTIDRPGDDVWCGADDGLYRMRGEEIVHLRFEPDAAGKLTMAGRPPTVR